MSASPRTPARPALAVIVAASLLVAACTGGAILANPPANRPTAPPTATPPPVGRDPVPIVLPRDDAPHDRLTEWWYYTGHLRAGDGARFGFEYVIFRAERGAFPVSWASHLALTDEAGHRFLYAQRSEIGPQVDRTPAAAPAGYSFAISGTPGDAAQARPPWTMGRADGADRLVAAVSAAEVAAGGQTKSQTAESPPPSFGLDLRLSGNRPAALHDGDGWIGFGPAGGSYYYSRTRQTAAGTLTLGPDTMTVDGIAWFDHQWGDFIAVGGGGWDWFAVNLDDGTDLTMSRVRDRDGSYPLVYGTLVDAEGGTRHLPGTSFTTEATGRWGSPWSGAEYPVGWRITIPGEDLSIDLQPVVDGQELDTRQTTGVIYWEGAETVRATRAGRSLGGEAYVELTGYAPAER